MRNVAWGWALFLLSVGLAGRPLPLEAWDYEGHRLINQLALACLPTNFPAFVQTEAARERIQFLAGEPDRWRNTSDLPLKHYNNPDHYFDFEDLVDYQLEPGALPHFRYEFVEYLAKQRALNPSLFRRPPPGTDPERTKLLVGFLPWAITEQYARLKSAFSYLKTFEESGAPDEIQNAQQNVVYYMAVLGHYIGDGAQPLHTTRNYNGWFDANPRSYNTNRTFHAQIDGGFMTRLGGLKYSEFAARARPAQMLWPGDPKAKHDDVFPEVIQYLSDQFKKVEPLYELEKAGKLAGPGSRGGEAKEFLVSQMAVASRMLADLWYSAWQQAPPDAFLKSYLARRKLPAPQRGTEPTK
jgi:hypothetical protein